jgi:hypothetical protein
MSLNESIVEAAALEWFGELGYSGLIKTVAMLAGQTAVGARASARFNLDLPGDVEAA